MANIDLFQLDGSIAIKGDDVLSRNITLGQQVTNSDVVIIDTANTALTSAGALTLASTATADTFIPTRGGSTNLVYGDALGAWVSGLNNVAMGDGALDALTTGADMVGIGLRAGQNCTTGSNTVFIGKDAGQDGDVSNVVAIGSEAFQHGTSDNNVAIGAGAMLGDIATPHDGQFNIAIGGDAMKSLSGTRWNNIAIGGRAMRDSVTGNGNTIIGKDGFLVATDGINNVMIGNSCGNQMPDGDSNIFIGAGTGNDITVATDQQFRVAFAGGGNTAIICGEMAATGQKCGINTYITNDGGTTPSELYGTLTIRTKSTDALPTLSLDQEDTDEPFIDFRGTEGAAVANSLSSRTAPGVPQGYAQIEINGTDKEWVQRLGDPGDPAFTLAAAATTLAATTQFMVITGDAGTNTLATITGGVAGMELTLLFVDGLVTITDTAAATADTVNLSAAFTSAANTVLKLVHDGNKWFEVSRSVN